MTRCDRNQPQDDTLPHIIIVDASADGVRQAAWFTRHMAKEARVLAKAARLHVISGEESSIRKLAASLQKGRVENNALALADVGDDTRSELQTLIGAAQSASNASEPEAPTLEEDDCTAALQEEAAIAAQASPGDPAVAEPDDLIELCRPSARLWDSLAPGDTVLAADLDRKGQPEAWYEAIIVRRAGCEFILRWRDFPRDGLPTRTRQHIALLYPPSP